MKGVQRPDHGKADFASEAGDDWVKSLPRRWTRRLKDIRPGGQTINSVTWRILAALISPRNSNTCVASIKSWWIEFAAMNKRAVRGDRRRMIMEMNRRHGGAASER